MRKARAGIQVIVQTHSEIVELALRVAAKECVIETSANLLASLMAR